MSGVGDYIIINGQVVPRTAIAPTPAMSQPRATPTLVPQREIVPGQPGPSLAIPQSVAPLLNGATDKLALRSILEAYRATYMPWWYGFSNQALAIGLTAQVPINIHPDSYFVCTHLLGT